MVCPGYILKYIKKYSKERIFIVNKTNIGTLRNFKGLFC